MIHLQCHLWDKSRGGGNEEMSGGLLDERALPCRDKRSLKDYIVRYNTAKNGRRTTSIVGDVVMIID